MILKFNHDTKGGQYGTGGTVNGSQHIIGAIIHQDIIAVGILFAHYVWPLLGFLIEKVLDVEVQHQRPFREKEPLVNPDVQLVETGKTQCVHL